MERWSNPLGPTSQKLDKNSPCKTRAKQGIQPSKNRRLHPLGSIKIIKKNLDLKTVPISNSSGLKNINQLFVLSSSFVFQSAEVPG